MFKNITNNGLNIWQTILIIIIYFASKLLISIGLSEILTQSIENLVLEVELIEFLSTIITLILLLIIIKRGFLGNKSNVLPLPRVILFLPLIGLVIGFRIIEDPFFRYEHFFLSKPIYDHNSMEMIKISAALVLRGLHLIFFLPILEELLFRKVIFNSLLKKYSNIWIALIISSILFSSIHLSIIGFVPKFLFGLIAAYIYFKSKSLWYPISFHVLSNLIWFTIYVSPKNYWELLNKLNFRIGYWILVTFGIGLVLVILNQYRKHFN